MEIKNLRLWKEAILEALEHETYGNMSNCPLCMLVRNLSEDESGIYNCLSCIAVIYLKRKKGTLSIEPSPEYCVYAIRELTRKDFRSFKRQSEYVKEALENLLIWLNAQQEKE